MSGANRAAYLRARKAKRRAKGQCIDCENPSPVLQRCEECRRCLSLKRKR